MKSAVVISFLMGLILGLILRRLVSSFETELSGSVQKTASGSVKKPQVALYEDCNFKGKSVTLGPGKYESIDKAGIRNDALSSLYIPPGFRVTLYEDYAFKGQSLVYAAKTDELYVKCLTEAHYNRTTTWNDRVSSLIIEAM